MSFLDTPEMEQREDAVETVWKETKHLPRNLQFATVVSWMAREDIQDLANFLRSKR